MKDNYVRAALDFISHHLKYPDQMVLETPTGPEVVIAGKKVLMFGSYNYLNLANNEEVKEKAVKTLRDFGVGSGGVRILTGTFAIHKELESKLAKITGHEDALTIPSGYGTNIGVIPGVMNPLNFAEKMGLPGAVIYNDSYNHASIVDGNLLSGAKMVKFDHLDWRDLNNKISEADHKALRKLIITDGVFSMDGDIAPLGEIYNVAKENDALLMVDDAHGFGALGIDGGGTAVSLGLKGKVDINMGTFSKGIGVSGGFVSGSKELIDLLRVTTRSYMFSDSLSPVIVGAVMAALEYIHEHPEIIVKLSANAKMLRERLNELGFDTLGSSTHIVPLVTGDTKTTIMFSRLLLENGICGPAVRWPAVPRDKGRIRLAVTAGHTEEQIDTLVKTILNVSQVISIPRK